MKTSIQEKKAKALELLKQLDICKDYVEIFKEKDIVTYFEQYIGYWAFQEEDLMARIKAFEEKWNNSLQIQYRIIYYTLLIAICPYRVTTSSKKTTNNNSPH